MKLTITNSERISFLQCKLKHAYQYRDLLASKEPSVAASLGGYIHEAISFLYKNYGNDREHLMVRVDSMEYLDSLFDSEIQRLGEEGYDDEIIEEFIINKGIAHILLDWYIKLYFLEEEYQLIEPEMNFCIPIPVPGSGRNSTKFEFAGKIDGVFRGVDSNLYIHEIKTRSGWGESSQKYLEIDEQITGYVWALTKKFDMRVTGVIYTILKKPSLVRKKDRETGVWIETVDQYIERLRKDYEKRPDFYFWRGIVYRGDRELEQFEKRIYWVAKEISRANRNDFRHKQPAELWANYCAICDYYQLCVSGDSEEVKNERFRIKSKKHEELDF